MTRPESDADCFERVYARLLALYPRTFRERFEGDMRDLFRDQLQAARSGGGGCAVTRYWMRTLLALLATATPRAHR